MTDNPTHLSYPRRPALSCRSYEVHGRDGIAGEWGAYCSLPADHRHVRRHERDAADS